MATFYLVLITILFLLAISDLIVGVSNDAVNFLNSAVGAKAANFKIIMAVAAFGILAGALFSSGMMEVARKGIFHPEFFHFSDLMIVFVAVMITDVILLDTFNTFGMPTSTTVSIVFELLGASLAIAAIKVFTDPNAMHLYEYINSAKALAIISGILLSVVIAFTAGVIIQYLSRLLFSFDYHSKLKWFGGMWGGLAITAITYFMLVKGSGGASFISNEMQANIARNSIYIISFSFIGWTVLLSIAIRVFKLNILKFIVLFGTFALAMAFAGNDLVNFIGVPLAGYNSYLLFIQDGMQQSADQFLMDGLAGKVPTPTYLLVLAGLIMVITLWTSKKARSVVQTSVNLGRQEEGYERFSSFVLSRRIVRNIGSISLYINSKLPGRFKKFVEKQFDQKPFLRRQVHLGKEAPSFDMVRASVTLVLASILITLGTNLKLPLSTTYVTFMVFMGTSLADGAWGRESAVYRVTGVLSVIGGWFFTALSAFTVAFVMAILFYYGGIYTIVGMVIIASIIIYRTHRFHHKWDAEQKAYEQSFDEEVLTKANVIQICVKQMQKVFNKMSSCIDKTMEGLEIEDLGILNLASKDYKSTHKRTEKLKTNINKALEHIDENELEVGHMYILVVDYLKEMSNTVRHIVDSSLYHIDNNHKSLSKEQIEELQIVYSDIKNQMEETIRIYETLDLKKVQEQTEKLSNKMLKVREFRKNQIKRIKRHESGTRNSQLYFNILTDFRNLRIILFRLTRAYTDLILDPSQYHIAEDG